MQRREAIKQGFSLVGLLAAGGFAYGEFASASPVLKLRPPGAMDEDKFLSLCIRCGICVDACPFHTLKLAQFRDGGIGMGTPFFKPREIPCYMCTDIPCAVKCPTGALDASSMMSDGKLDINKSRMGMAVVDDKTCIAYFGLRCDACYRNCPLIDKALKLEYKHNERTGKHAFLLPIVDTDVCTGCGKCEQSCITKKASITVVPREVIKGEMNDNYIKGWDEGDFDRIKNPDTKIKLNSKKSLNYLNDGDEL
ncbi:menaquinol dehydrogenase NapGH, periplasmic component NapG [Campylobacter iguaniorum]|uniref:ferredoxin-type protein NapG n=1 Tax=Campylobacter iguaniorum TaxID=1244531 RepID=UPI00073A02F6|nr:ferredoxin-type protein NapG [Campylobacter iguaniorum]ALV24866.1 menaquinol dehydrogenase NapGH, periplasmic component NapG [Campylobacter iguaniorum]